MSDLTQANDLGPAFQSYREVASADEAIMRARAKVGTPKAAEKPPEVQPPKD